MPLESATYISDLDPSNPVGSSDLVSSLDDHMRLVKATLQTTFPGIAGAVTATHVELNHLDGVTGTTGTGKLVLDDAPTIADLTVTDSVALPANSVADAALSDNVPLKDAPNTFTALQTLAYADPSIQLVETDAGENEGVWWIRVQAGRFIIQGRQDSGSASGASNIIDIMRDTGATSAAEIELNATTLDFNGDADISGSLTVGGTITGSGSGLSSLNASNLSTGTVNSDRLPSTIGGNKTFSGNVSISGATTVGGALTANGNVDINANLDLAGATVTTNISMSGTRTIDATTRLNLTGSTVSVGESGGALGFYGSAGISKPSVFGKINDGSALISLLNQLESLGLITKAWTET